MVGHHQPRGWCYRPGWGELRLPEESVESGMIVSGEFPICNLEFHHPTRSPSKKGRARIMEMSPSILSISQLYEFPCSGTIDSSICRGVLREFERNVRRLPLSFQREIFPSYRVLWRSAYRIKLIYRLIYPTRIDLLAPLIKFWILIYANSQCCNSEDSKQK